MEEEREDEREKECDERKAWREERGEVTCRWGMWGVRG